MTPTTLKHPLGETSPAARILWLTLDASGSFLQQAGGDEPAAVAPEATERFLRETIDVPDGTTDVFIWVHGWRNEGIAAAALARRFASGIEETFAAERKMYPRLIPFRPVTIAIQWPSATSAGIGGYATARDRAHAMTRGGNAQFAIAALLGYVDEMRDRFSQPRSDLLRARAGFFVHCVGHSFGGRLLGEALTALVDPIHEVWTMLERTAWKPLPLGSIPRYDTAPYTVDSLILFQMAAPADVFAAAFNALVHRAPIVGPICVTHSRRDSACCFWHARAEGREAVGCKGATSGGNWSTLFLLPLSESYPDDILASRSLINVDANKYFTRRRPPNGAHSDIWYQESIHLVLSIADSARANMMNSTR